MSEWPKEELRKIAGADDRTLASLLTEQRVHLGDDFASARILEERLHLRQRAYVDEMKLALLEGLAKEVGRGIEIPQGGVRRRASAEGHVLGARPHVHGARDLAGFRIA